MSIEILGGRLEFDLERSGVGTLEPTLGVDGDQSNEKRSLRDLVVDFGVVGAGASVETISEGSNKGTRDAGGESCDLGGRSMIIIKCWNARPGAESGHCNYTPPSV